MRENINKGNWNLKVGYINATDEQPSKWAITDVYSENAADIPKELS